MLIMFFLDTFNMKSQFFARLATPEFPFMDDIDLDTFYFFVPFRLVWDNWQKFCGEQIDPGDSTDYLIPIMDCPSGGIDVGTLGDHLGVPTGVGVIQVSALPQRAYFEIWNQWFRDQNLQDSVVVPKGDGPDTMYNLPPLKRGKRHDYFTSCFTTPQKGPAAVVPLASSAPVVSNDEVFNLKGPLGTDRNLVMTSGSNTVVFNSTGDVNGGVSFGTESGLEVDTTALGGTINQLRLADSIQTLLERDMRGGTRYTEIVRSHFGVVSPDARLQRPEYLGGGSFRVNIHPVAQTSESGSDTPQGNLAAFGTSSGRSGFNKTFVEHGVVIGLCAARAALSYQQGIQRFWQYRSRYDFYWPALANLGEQAVLNREIYIYGDPSSWNGVFGYQERWAELRYKPSEIHGQFRSQAAQSLDPWHLAQDFGSLPVLNDEFIEENPPLDRVIAVTDYPDFLLDVYHNLRCARPMPTYSVPGLGSRF
jgi:hypothetical protein